MPDIAHMAEAVEALENFATHTTATHATLRVLCRFSSTSGRDLIHQVDASGADVVVISDHWVRRHPAAYNALDAVTVLVVPAERPAAWLAAGTDAALAVSDDVVYVRDDGGPNGARAVVVASRAATHSGRSLTAIMTAGHAMTGRLRQALEPLRSTATDVSFLPMSELDGSADAISAVGRVLDRVGGSQIDLRDAVADSV